MGYKGPVLRPWCIGPGRARNQLLFYSILNEGHMKGNDETSEGLENFNDSTNLYTDSTVHTISNDV